MKLLTAPIKPAITRPAAKTLDARPTLGQLHEQWSRRFRPARRGRRLRARQILIQSALIFLLAQIIPGWFLLGSGQTWRDPIFQARLELLQRQNQDHPDWPIVALVGSSRFLYGVDLGTLTNLAKAEGQPITPACFALHGGGPSTQLLMTRRLLRAGVKPNLLVAELVPSLLDERALPDDLEAHRLPTSSLVQQDLELLERYTRVDRAEAQYEWRLANLVPLYTFRFALISAVCPRLLPLPQRTDAAMAFNDLTQGNSPLAALTPGQRQAWLSQARHEHAPRLEKVKENSLASQALLELGELCRREGIPLMVLLTPEGPAFQSWYTPSTRREMEVLVNRLTVLGATVIDAQTWLPDEAWFADSHHLLPQGGLAFTNRLWREALRKPVEGR